MRRTTLLLLTVMVMGACVGPSTSRVSLEGTFELEAVRTGRIDFGTCQARPHQVHGFRKKELVDDHGATYVQGRGDSSQLRFYLAAPGDLVLDFRASPSDTVQPPTAAVAIEVNEHPIEVVEFNSGFNEYRCSIPAQALKSGENLMSLRYRPSPVDRKANHTAWDWMEFSELDPPSLETEADPPVLTIPSAGTVHCYLKPASGYILDTGKVEPLVRPGLAPESTALKVTVQQESREPEEFVVPEDGRRLELPVSEASGIVRLSLTAHPQDPEAQGTTGLRIRPTLLSPSPRGTAKSQVARRPNIVIYLVDTLRSDHLGCYGYHRPTSPHLDRFAAQATVFEQARAQSSWTKTSVASMMTGQFPRTHTVLDFSHKLTGSTVLAELLQQAGYTTRGFNTNGWLTSEFGFDRGYDSYRTFEGMDSHELNNVIFEWLDKAREDQPFFLYVHTLDPHDPYNPQPRFRKVLAPQVKFSPERPPSQILQEVKKEVIDLPEGLREDLVALYDAEIRANDAAFGRLLRKLRKLGLYESSIIIFLSDHGEEFQEHGDWHHGRSLYEEVLRVPLVIKFPEGFAAGVRVGAMAQHVDLLPTLLDLLGVPRPEGLEGQSLRPFAESPDGRHPSRPSYATLLLSTDKETDPTGNPFVMELDSVFEGGRKLIRAWRHRQWNVIAPLEFFDLTTDAEEREPLEERTLTDDYLYSRIRALNRNGAEAPQVDSSRVRDKLHSLQYL